MHPRRAIRTILAAGVVLLGISPAARHTAAAPPRTGPSDKAHTHHIADVRLELLAHKDTLTGPGDHLGTLLFDASGQLGRG